MIINSISMKNFQCYAGEHESNYLEFSNGLNLIIGDNGGGKSKLYDAFYWVIHNKIFQSDQRDWVSTKIYKENLISDKAKSECQIGETITSEVTMIVTSRDEKKYKLERIYEAKKIGEREWSSKADSAMLVSVYSHAKWNIVPEPKHEKILNRVIPGHIEPYMWFQGEQVDSLMDLTDSTALEQVVNLLSDIKDYDDLIAITTTGASRTASDLIRHKNKLSNDEKKSNELNATLEASLKSIYKYEKDIEVCDYNIETAKVKVEELISKVEDAEAKADYKSRRKALVDLCKNLEKSLLEKHGSFSKNIFKKHWILKNVDPFFKKFEAKYKKYSKEHNRKENENSRVVIKLPLNVPQPIHVERMIEEESCFVCGSAAPKGSLAHEHILSLIERKPPKDIFTNDLSSDFEGYYNNNLRYGISIQDIDSSISEELSVIQDLKNKRVVAERQIREIDNQFDILLEEDKSEDILGEFKQQNRSRERFEQNKARLLEKLRVTTQQRDDAKTGIDKLVTGEIDKVTLISEKIFSQLKSIAKSTKQQVFESIILELEEKSNEIFRDMTHKNTSIKGKIKFKKITNGSYIPEIVDGDDYIINSPNDSNIILVKLSLIMAILTARAKWSDNYALISDAPTSKMADNYTFGFYKTVSERFTQSIVTTYDFLEAERKAVLSNFNMGKVYQIESHYPSGNSDNRADLCVKITEVTI
ncbi:MAG: AAA family ATPase [Oceanospirillaceae bacterium]|nr:AAA family ATPase [Oceanospirillaceae bacterium]